MQGWSNVSVDVVYNQALYKLRLWTELLALEDSEYAESYSNLIDYLNMCELLTVSSCDYRIEDNKKFYYCLLETEGYKVEIDRGGYIEECVGYTQEELIVTETGEILFMYSESLERRDIQYWYKDASVFKNFIEYVAMYSIEEIVAELKRWIPTEA
jgi:hypothetical protein